MLLCFCEVCLLFLRSVFFFFLRLVRLVENTYLLHQVTIDILAEIMELQDSFEKIIRDVNPVYLFDAISEQS